MHLMHVTSPPAGHAKQGARNCLNIRTVCNFAGMTGSSESLNSTVRLKKERQTKPWESCFMWPGPTRSVFIGTKLESMKFGKAINSRNAIESSR
jgi:hypothetical protein